MTDRNKTRSIKEPLLGGGDGEQSAKVHEGYGSDYQAYLDESYDRFDMEGGTPAVTPRGTSGGKRRDSKDFDPRSSQMKKLDMHLFRFVRQRKFATDLDSEDSDEAAERKMNEAFANSSGKNILKKLNTMGKGYLPKGELDDSGSFNALVDSQFDPAFKGIKYRDIKLRYRPQDDEEMIECFSEQNS